MRMRRIVLLTAAAVMLAGCGDRYLVLKVDALSFTDPASRAADFGPIPVFPGGFVTPEIPVVNDQHVSLLQGMSDAVNITSVTVSLGALVIDYDGSGEATIRLYLSDDQTDPLTTPPALTEIVTLVPAQTDTIRDVLGDDPRVRDLFAGREMRMSVTVQLHGPLLGSSLSGRFEFTNIDAVVIARSKGF